MDIVQHSNLRVYHKFPISGVQINGIAIVSIIFIAIVQLLQYHGILLKAKKGRTAIDGKLKPLPNNILLRSQIPQHGSLSGDQILGNKGDFSALFRVINEGIGDIAPHYIDSTNASAQKRRTVPVVMGAAGLTA